MFANCQGPPCHKLALKTIWGVTSSKEWVIPGGPLFPTWVPPGQLRGKEVWKEPEEVRPSRSVSNKAQSSVGRLSATRMHPQMILGHSIRGRRACVTWPRAGTKEQRQKTRDKGFPYLLACRWKKKKER